MPGWLSNGAPTVGPIFVNGVQQTVAPMNFNGAIVSGGPAPVYTMLSAGALFTGDTEQGGGVQPQSVAATAFQIAAHAASLAVNTGTSTAGAATLNTKSGRVVTEALTTAPGASYSFVLTNSLFTVNSPAPQVHVTDGTNTGGTLQLTSITLGAGTATITLTNVGTSALNGTLVLAFHV